MQTDIRMPKRHLRLLEDGAFNSAFQQAIETAVAAIAAEDKDCRVLNLGAGAGLHAMMALRAGAHYVTAVERWLYLALACKECMLANQVGEGSQASMSSQLVSAASAACCHAPASPPAAENAPALLLLLRSSQRTSSAWCTSAPPTSIC